MEAPQGDSMQVRGRMAAGSIARKRLRWEGEQERRTREPEGPDFDHRTRGNHLNPMAVMDLEERVPMFIPVGHLRKKVQSILEFQMKRLISMFTRLGG